ncbi:TetR/AcrR family transcriptional regulator [Nocardioides sp. R-C-SC26]|uniref:TetR/AcrR family transcriptional regulator n=1 Tax=Nocardioides sp. R-C-SC26 TaxID=2870414 RepID=UPI001E4F8C42|nr:TetR/AcrR family transcriptional regulator [Nocardioides sp. R-C-SC26]
MRRSLLDAAVAILEAEGYDRLTTTAISRRAHVSSGTFYRYFNDKAEIMEVLRDEAVAAISDDLMVGVVAALDLDVEPALERVVETLIDGFEAHRAVILAIINQMPAGNNANILPEVEAQLRQLASLLPRRHLPDLDEDGLDAVVFMTMGVLVSTCLRIALQRPAHVERERLVAIAVGMLAGGMVAARA